MNIIQNSKSLSNYESTNIENLKNTKATERLTKEISNNSIKGDSIEISEQNLNIINIKKSYDAFRETCSESSAQIIHSDGSIEKDFSLMFTTMVYEMNELGISTPSFEPSADNSSEFLSFIDTMKNFMKERSEKYPNDFYTKYTDDFLNFCDSFKEKLIQYDCK